MLLLIKVRVFTLCFNIKRELVLLLALFNVMMERIKQKDATVFINGPAVNVISLFFI